MRFGLDIWGNYSLKQWVEYVVLAEKAGFEVAWTGDTQLLTPDVYATIALCANATSKILLATGVTNSVTRDLTVTAGSILSVQQYSNGRCLLGIGVGGSSTGTVGLPEEKIGEFRRKVLAIKQLVQGGSAEVNGRTVASKIETAKVPVYIGTASQKGLALAGEIADGVIMNVGIHPDLIREGLRHVAAGAEKAGRSLRDIAVNVIVGCYIDDDEERALAACKPWAAITARRVGKWMRAADIQEAGSKILAGHDWDKHLETEASHDSLPLNVVRDFALAGPASHCRKVLRELEACGVTEIAPVFMHNDLSSAIGGFGRDIISTWDKLQ
jgi:5,10-methylenetetrahydromethanopterin reductase